MKLLSLENVMEALEFELSESLPRQMMRPDHPLYGAYISPQTQLDEAGHGGTSRFLMTCGLVLLWQLRKGEAANKDILKHMNAAANYLLTAQRETGLIDLRNVNYDSAPDTGFAVQLLCAFYEHGQS